MNLLIRLANAQKNLDRAKQSRCFCGPLVKRYKEPCNCGKAEEVKRAEIAMNKIREEIRKLNLKILE